MSLSVSRILHAGYLFEHKETQILFDPIFENPFSHNCYAYPNVQFDVDSIKKLKPSAIFISHYHDDHCSFESLNLINRQTPIYVYCINEELVSLIKELGFKKVNSLDLNIPIQIGEFNIIPRAALDRDVDCLFQIQIDGLNILNVVDSWIDSDCLTKLSKFSPWDLVLWPFQTLKELDVISPRQAMLADKKLPIEWLDQIQTLNPKVIIPSSCQFIFEKWSWMNQAYFPITYKQFEIDVLSRLPKTEVIKLDPSCSLVYEQSSFKKSSPLSWVQPLGPQDLDYEYDQNLKPTAMSEIAKKFAALSETQNSLIRDYCSHDLLKIYSALEIPEDSYFSEPKVWNLATYDHLGIRSNSFYKIQGKLIEPIDGLELSFDWLTEIPISKILAALKGSETTNSIYIRINDFEESNQKLDP